MTTRRTLLIAAGSALATSLSSIAQQSRVRRIGFLAVRSRSTSSEPDVLYDAFVQGMRELGYVEGKNLIIEWRFADGNYDRLPDLAAELVGMKVEVLVTHATAGARAAQRATRTIPIVTATSADPVSQGFAASLARPGGNITGLSDISVDLSPKRLELLRTIMPALSRVAVLVNPGNAAHPEALKSIQAAAQQASIKILTMEARTPEEIKGAFATMTRERVGAVMVPPDGFFVGQSPAIVALALRNRILSTFPDGQPVVHGGLMSYGPNLADLYRRAATYVDKILKGAKAGELPIEQPTKLELVMNRRTANALGLTIPQSILISADRVIE